MRPLLSLWTAFSRFVMVPRTLALARVMRRFVLKSTVTVTLKLVFSKRVTFAF